MSNLEIQTKILSILEGRSNVSLRGISLSLRSSGKEANKELKALIKAGKVIMEQDGKGSSKFYSLA